MALQLAKTFAWTGIALLVVVVWAVTVAYVFRDTARRNLPEERQIAWLAVVALVPLVGYLFYLSARRLGGMGWLPARRNPDLDDERRKTDTQVRPYAEVQAVPGVRVPVPTEPVQVYEASPQHAPHAQHKAPQNVPHIVPSLAVIQGPYAGQQFDRLALPALIGRGTEVAVRLDDDRGVSRQHAELYERDGSLRIRDLDSTHGTYLNGFRIQDMSVRPGDQVQVGSSVLQVKER